MAAAKKAKKVNKAKQARKGGSVPVRAAVRARAEGKKRPNVAGGLPIHIRNFGTPVTDEDRQGLRRRLEARLARYGDRVERASVRLEDLNGPRGGIDQRCRIKVVLSNAPSVVVEAQHAELRDSMDIALRRTAAAVRSAVERRDRQRRVVRGRNAPADS